MGATLLRSNFRINFEDTGAALQALKEWAIGVTDLGTSITAYQHEIELMLRAVEQSTNLCDALNALGWDLVFDDVPDGNVTGIEQHTFDNVSALHAGAMASLRGIVRPGSFLIFHGEDDSIFKWEWVDATTFRKQGGGRIVFDLLTDMEIT